MERETCVFYASWFDAIETMPEAAQSEAYRAVLSYALRGEETAKQGAMTKLIMAMVRPVIDANNKRYENGCKGGRPKVEKPNNNQNETKAKPNNNQNETTSQVWLGDNDNENVNVNVNDNVNESVCDKSHNNAHAHAQEIFEKFISWCEENAPSVNRFKEPLTLEHFIWLASTYKTPQLKRCAAELHNKEAYKKNVRAITAWKSFMSKII